MSNAVSKLFSKVKQTTSSPRFQLGATSTPLGRNVSSENIPVANIRQSKPRVAATPARLLRPASKPNLIATPQPRRATPSVDNEDTGLEIKVFLRIRPLNKKETQANFEVDGNDVVAYPPTKPGDNRHYAENRFTFSKIFPIETSQSDVFESVAMPLLRRFTRGTDSLLFAYGATSAGKTHTIQGSKNDQGLLPRIINTILSREPKPNTERALFMSVIEVYNERVHDLLGDATTPLRLGLDTFGYTIPKGAVEIELNTIDDYNAISKTIEKARKKRPTSNNANSSRSHLIYQMKLITIPLNPRTGERTSDLSQMQCSRLSVVDLAGSERVTDRDTNQALVSEACNINKSMLVLGRCIRDLRNHSKSVPFRESKLTQLFKDYFDNPGDSAIFIIVNISPSVRQFDETLFSLQFAAEVVNCKVKSVDIEEEEEEDEPEIMEQIDDGIENDEIVREMMAKIQKIQEDMQIQLEDIKAHSAQPYGSKLQQALAEKLNRETKQRELEHIKAERDRAAEMAEECRQILDTWHVRIKRADERLQEEKDRSQKLEDKIRKMIDATKSLYEKHQQTRAELEDRRAALEEIWGERIRVLTEEIEDIKKGREKKRN